MDLSGMIFVALAVAWAVYLIPKALRHHDEVARSRSVDRFSDTMRVLARREPVTRRDARLVVTPGRPSSAAEITVKASHLSPARRAMQRDAARRATSRRRRVLGLLLVANVAVAGVAAAGVISWVWQAVPAGLVVVWLILCRVMVKSERAALVPETPTIEEPAAAESDLPEVYFVERNGQGFDEVTPGADTSTMPAVVASDMWDPVPVTLPTYVTKLAATRRTVRTIDLGEPGAWTSGHTDDSSAMVRAAEAEAAVGVATDDEPRSAVGS